MKPGCPLKVLTRSPFFALVLQGKWKPLAVFRATPKRCAESSARGTPRGVENSCS